MENISKEWTLLIIQAIEQEKQIPIPKPNSSSVLTLESLMLGSNTEPWTKQTTLIITIR